LLVDVVTYSGERDLLLARLDILQPDVCVVVESDHTFTGEWRGFTFQRNPIEGVRFVPHFSGRLPDPWQNEYALRRAGHHAVKKLEVPDDATVGFFDVDEIPDPTLIRSSNRLSVWKMAKYQMSLRWFQRHEETGISAPWRDVKNADIAQVRRERERLPRIDGGLHLSSFGTVDDLMRKWLGFAHTEFVRPDMKEWVAHCWDNGVAIESGSMLDELAELSVSLPNYFLDGKAPDYWYRTRPV
jgi:hypothetical protein